ncbi:Por secretion system C-terminal sorting domain-containing protein [Chitinophaga sp. YR627]|uniref:galactose-binding domain-containing protein n=1 Tax=Chitinophaga sp. YR627 TaxID=1881041 RepID=UPI0008E0DEB0|nr:discoidin domain-containing protein [Chitinophaga sp. YR627]SFM70015.1 Por secretion system C-terminal sorting domain-containing protein [Chitinophaga sp. YR627]
MKTLLSLSVALLLCCTVRAQNWTLIWSDEFNGPSLDLTKWSYETGTGVNGDFGTGQLDRATNRIENVGIESGIAGANGNVLRISTRKEFYIDRNYTSGRINSNGKASWGPQHRIVARVWPKGVRTMGQGFAFWMMPDELPQGQSTISWPQGGEIDIMEYVGSIPTFNLGSTHYAWAWNNNQWADWNHGHQGGYYSFAEQQAPDNPEYIRVDLGAVVSVDRVELSWENTGKSFKIQTSTDGTTWSDAYTTTAGDGGIDNITFGARNARFVRMYGTQRSNDWGYSLFEFQVFGGSSANLALNKPAVASSTQGADVAAGLAFDGSATTRWSSSLRNPDYQCCAQSSTTDPAVAANGWHEYGIDWFADRMEFFVDGNVYHIHYFEDGAAFAADGQNEAQVQVINGKRVRKSEFSNLYSEWHPFEHKMYAILSVGVGGSGNTYGGPIVDQAIFPADVYIDWVRVYSNGITYNPPPVVALTAPTGTETYAAPGNITLTATASDRDGGTISSVTFYNGTAVIGTDNSAPYSVQWNNVAAGSYTITAKATDNGGATATSNAVTIAVNGTSSNLALNRPGTASSVTGAFAASNAFDASATSRWESAYADPQWIYVDLGNTYNVNRVKITWEPAMGKDYRIEISNDLNNWQLLKTVTGNTALVNDWTALSGSGRYVRVYGTARGTQYGYSIFGMEVYGSGASTSANIALNKTGTASSVTGVFNANNAFDADAGSRWESAYTDPQWIYVDLGGNYNVNRVKVTWETALGRDYRVEISTDLNNWQVLKTVTANTALANDWTGLSGTGRYVRIYGTARGTQWGYSIFSTEVYGSAASLPANTQAALKPAEDKIITAKFRGYPNPVVNNYNVEGVEDRSHVTVLYMDGTPALRTQVTGAKIDLSQLKAGMYIIRIFGKEGVINQKIIKQ